MTVTRVRYREGQRLQASDLSDEQSYRLEMQRRHNLGPHGWGIVAGLELCETAAGVELAPGLAIDGYGRELLVPAPIPLEAKTILDECNVEAIDLWLIYRRTADTPARRGRWACGPGQHSRWVESTMLRITPATTINPRRPLAATREALDFRPHQPPPDDPDRAWPVFLGRISYDLFVRADESLKPPGWEAFVALAGDAAANEVLAKLLLFQPADFKDPYGLIFDLRADKPISRYLFQTIVNFRTDDFSDMTGPARAVSDPAHPLYPHFFGALLTFQKRDFVQATFQAFIYGLQSGDVLAKHFLNLFSPEAKTLIQAYDGQNPPLAVLFGVVLNELNGLLTKQGLYDSDVFPDDMVRDETKRFIGQNPQGVELRHFNRLLLEDAFPEAIAKVSIFAYDDFDPLAPEPLLGALNRLLAGPSLFDLATDIQPNLRHETVRLGHLALTGSDLMFTNRLILEDLFPKEITPLPPFYYDGFQYRSAVLVKNIARILNERLLQGPSLYGESLYTNIVWRDRTKELAAASPQGLEILYLNRLLIEDSFPDRFNRLAIFSEARPDLQPGERLAAWAERLNHLLLGPPIEGDLTGISMLERACRNRVYLENILSGILPSYQDQLAIDLDHRPYIRLVGEMVSLPPQPKQPTFANTRLRAGSPELPSNRQALAIVLPDKNNRPTTRFSIDNQGHSTIHSQSRVGRVQAHDPLILAECYPDFCLADIKNGSALAEKLIEAGDTVSQFIWNQADDETKRAMLSHYQFVPASFTLKRSLVRALNQTLLVPDLPGSESPEYGRALARFNRKFLEGVYPQEIVRDRAHPAPPGGIEFGPLPAPPAVAAPWQVYHTTIPQENKPTVNQLRFEIEHPGDKGDPHSRQLVIGRADPQNESKLIPCLAVTASCEVLINGDLTIEGPLVQGEIPADLNDPRFVSEVMNSWMGGITTGGAGLDRYYRTNLLQLEFDVFPTSTSAGEPWTYVVLVSNYGEVAVSNIQVSESVTFPDGRSEQRMIQSGITLGPMATSGPIRRTHTIPSTATAGQVISVIVSAVGFDPLGDSIQITINGTATIQDPQPPVG